MKIICRCLDISSFVSRPGSSQSERITSNFAAARRVLQPARDLRARRSAAALLRLRAALSGAVFEVRCDYGVVVAAWRWRASRIEQTRGRRLTILIISGDLRFARGARNVQNAHIAPRDVYAAF